MKQSIKLLVIFIFFALFSQLPFIAEASEQGVQKPEPDQIINLLREGNERFYSGKATYPHTSAVQFMM